MQLSDLVGGQRSDHSHINEQLKSLQPGEVLTLECPPGIPLQKFRSAILTNSKRFHKNSEWRVTTRTLSKSRKVYCFLAPQAPHAPQ